MLKDLKSTDGGFVDENEVFWNTRKDYLNENVLEQCGCGDPDSIRTYVKEMLLTHVQRRDNRTEQNGVNKDYSWENNDYNDLPLMFFLNWANRKGFTDHGCAVRCSWLTEKGEQLLKDIEEIEKEEQAEKDNNE